MGTRWLLAGPLILFCTALNSRLVADLRPEPFTSGLLASPSARDMLLARGLTIIATTVEEKTEETC